MISKLIVYKNHVFKEKCKGILVLAKRNKKQLIFHKFWVKMWTFEMIQGGKKICYCKMIYINFNHLGHAMAEY